MRPPRSNAVTAKPTRWGRPAATGASANRGRTPTALLQASGWRPEARTALTRLIRRGAGKRLPVALDFDNTIVCGDVHEATLAVLLRKGALQPERIPRTLSPAFRLPEGTVVALDSGPDLSAYYEAFLAPTAHGRTDPTPMANGYAWAIEILEGLTPLEIVRATAEAFACGRPGQRRLIEVTPGKTAYPAPFFYPEMVELIGQLRRHDFDVWIVSASNTWSVRWMVAKALNPLLTAAGIHAGIPADHVLGVSTLLQDARGRLYKDSLLVREHPAYAALDERALNSFRLTSRLQFPVPTYSGKVASIWDTIGRRPCLAAGDSPGDLAMLAFSEHRLWIMRMEKPGYQEKTADCIRLTGKNGWIIQPVLGGESPGFLPGFDAPPAASASLRQALRRSHALLRESLPDGSDH